MSAKEHADGRKAFRLGQLRTERRALGEGHPTRLLGVGLAEVGDCPCRIGARVYLADMYAHGFVRDGDDVLDDGLPPVPMLRSTIPPPASSADERGPGVRA